MTQSEQTFLQVDDLTKYYEGNSLIKDLSFSIFDREILCLLGPSGSGKSTLLRIIAGLEPFESGQVSWRGMNLQSTPPERRSFGLMFQDYSLFPHLNVFENVAFGLRMQHLREPALQQKVAAELERVGMQAFAVRKVQNLSGGEQQRVALARTLAPNPDLIMLDEPLGALDRKLREQLTQEVRLILKSAGVPAIYVTHDQEEAFSLADRILLLSEGRIMQLGTPEELYNFPRNVWVARFLGLGTITHGMVISTKPTIIHTIFGDREGFVTKKPLHKGMPVNLLIRPTEVLKVNERQAGVLGIVRDCFFHGDHYRVNVNINGESFLVNLQDYYLPGAHIYLTLSDSPITLLETDTQ